MKKIQMTSILFLAIATVGFLIIPYYYDFKLKDLEEEREKLSSKVNLVITNLNNSQLFHAVGNLQFDHKEMLIALDRKDASDKIAVSMMNSLKSSIQLTIGAAQISGVIKQEEVDQYQNLEKYDNYEKVILLYLDYLRKAQEGYHNIKINIEKLNNEMSKIKSHRTFLFTLLIFFQIVGLILNAIVGLKKKEKEKSRLIYRDIRSRRTRYQRKRYQKKWWR